MGVSGVIDGLEGFVRSRVSESSPGRPKSLLGGVPLEAGYPPIPGLNGDT
jgi:hypothetical protein